MTNGNNDLMVKEEENSLFKFTNPGEMVEVATTVANTLAPLIEQQKLYANISGKKHVTVEGWTTLGFMAGVYATIESTNRIVREPHGKGRSKEEIIYEARAVAQRADGQIVGSAEMMCSSYEKNWSNRDEYAIKSMAETRAISKALRMPLGWIMTLSGYSATPAEEMPRNNNNNGAPGPQARAPQRKPAPQARPEPEGEIIDVTPEAELEEDTIKELCKQSGALKAIIGGMGDNITKTNILQAITDDERLHPKDKENLRGIVEGV